MSASCPGCGDPAVKGARFCRSCGAALTDADAAAAAPQARKPLPPVGAQPSPVPLAGMMPPPPEPPRPNRTVWWVTGALAALVIIAGGVVLAVTLSRHPHRSATTSSTWRNDDPGGDDAEDPSGPISNTPFTTSTTWEPTTTTVSDRDYVLLLAAVLAESKRAVTNLQDALDQLGPNCESGTALQQDALEGAITSRQGILRELAGVSPPTQELVDVTQRVRDSIQASLDADDAYAYWLQEIDERSRSGGCPEGKGNLATWPAVDAGNNAAGRVKQQVADAYNPIAQRNGLDVIDKHY